MERRRNNWGTSLYAIKSASRFLHRSSPNLSASSRALLSDDDDDDYGFIMKSPPPIPPPPIPAIPLEFQDEYQKRLKEQQNKAYWESIKRQLTDYYNHHHEFQHHERMSGTRGSSGMANKRGSMVTATSAAAKASVRKSQKNKQNTATQAVPVQSSLGLDDEWIAAAAGRRDSGSTSDLLDQVCEVQECCERFEDFRDEQDLRSSEKLTPLCVKCLVRYYNNGRPSTAVRIEQSSMSRVSFPIQSSSASQTLPSPVLFAPNTMRFDCCCYQLLDFPFIHSFRLYALEFETRRQSRRRV